jgi:hypothetical protein
MKRRTLGAGRYGPTDVELVDRNARISTEASQIVSEAQEARNTVARLS